LQVAQFCEHRFLKPWELVAGPLPEAFVGVVGQDRESGLGSRAVLASALEKELAGEMVKRRAQVVDDLSNRDAPTERRPVLHDEMERASASVRLEVLGDLVGIAAEEPGDLGVELLKLALCPPELVTGAV